jgi:DNA-directed RNA polymerase specialized sigma24 family protein
MREPLISEKVESDKQPADGQPFGSLLEWLGPEREEAGSIYEQVRFKLINLFEFQGCPFPEELADDTIERAARKISEGGVTRPADPYVYFRGIARNVLLEYWKARKRNSTTVLDDLPASDHPSVNPTELERQNTTRKEKERMLECMEYCLNKLPPDSREIFIEYNRSERRERIDNRMLLAQKSGIDINALRARIVRIRERLQKCVTNCARR